MSSTIFLIFLILRRVLRDIAINIYKSCKLSTILVGFWRNFNSLKKFSKNGQYQVSWNSFQCAPSCSMRMDRRKDGETDGQTDMTKLTVAFRNFANAPKKCLKTHILPFSYFKPFFGTDFPKFITVFPSQQPNSPSNLLTPQTISVFSQELKYRVWFTYCNVYISCKSADINIMLPFFT